VTEGEEKYSTAYRSLRDVMAECILAPESGNGNGYCGE
jgi:hypothetical protein